MSQTPVTPNNCLISYFKTYESDFESEFVHKYFLLRNNRQLLHTTGYQKLPNGALASIPGLKLLDAEGNFIKGVDFSRGFNTIAVDDQHILLVDFVGTDNNFIQTLVDENLDIVWTRTIKGKDDMYYGVNSISDVYIDEDKNAYLVSTYPGYVTDNGKVVISKLDYAGNEIWTSVHEIDGPILARADITASPAGLIVVAEGELRYSFLYNKSTGDIIKSYSFPSNRFYRDHNRYLKYDNGKVFYTALTADFRLLVGIFDSLARPVKMKYLTNSSTPLGVDSRNGFMVISFKSSSEVLLKLDTALSVQFMNAYTIGPLHEIKGLGIDPAGYIYSGGFKTTTAPSVNNPYLAKYGLQGEIGTCTFQPFAGSFIDIPITGGTIGYSKISRATKLLPPMMKAAPSTIVLYPDVDVCINVEPCNAISISDPGRICKTGTDYAIQFTTNPGCTLQPAWTFDAAYMKLVSSGTGTAVFQFIKPGLTSVIATIKTACGGYADTIAIQIDNDPASLNLGADTTICPGDSLILDAGGNFAQYIWQDGSSDRSFIVKNSGKYKVYVANSCGESFLDEINIIVRTIPPLFSVSSLTTCANDSFMISAEPSFTNYNWQAAGYVAGKGSTAISILSSPTSIIANALSPEHCLVKDTIAINLIYARQVNLGADTSICYTDSILLRAGTGYTLYSWSDGSGNAELKVSAAGRYFVTAKDINGCNARDTLLVHKFKTPVLTLGNDRSICINQPIQLNAGNFNSYMWQDGSTKQNITIQVTGIYWVSITDQNNCKASDTLIIRDMVAPPSGFLKATDSICRFRTLEIAALNDFQTFNWSTGANTSKTTISKTGNYSLTVSDQNGCIATETIRVIEKDCLEGVFVPNAFSPNRDGHNDLFRAVVHGPVLHYSITLFNRYGAIVFSTNDPSKSWDGFYKGRPAETGNYVWKCSYQLEGGKTSGSKGNILLIR
ncbi:T9SS type B sorting domain-containing protein [Flavitalea sp.]|nr:gliding motility-associated C-terminal domain-containing protein [Flavitalea sp.]